MFPAATFSWFPGDHAQYVAGDPAGAVALARSVPSLAVDIETRGLGESAWQITAVSVGTAGVAFVLDPERHHDAIREALAAAPELVLHNSSFDVPILYVAGLLAMADVDKVHDTLITARLAHPSERESKSLGDAAERHLHGGYSRVKASLEAGFRGTTGKSKRAMFAELSWSSPAFIAYAAFDVVMTARLRAVLPVEVVRTLADHPYRSLSAGDPWRLIDREQTINRMLLRRSCIGFGLDVAATIKIAEAQWHEVTRCDQELTAAGVAVAGLSAPKVKEAVVDRLEALGALPAHHPRLKSGRPSADRRAMERVHHRLAGTLRARSEAERFGRDYLGGLHQLAGAADNRIHPRVQVLAARTGRMSYGEPPLQQLPPQVRPVLRFDTPAVSMDWASIEPVFFANVVGETTLVDTFEAGGDLYLPVAELAGVDRATAKMIVLAQLYGQGAASLAGRLELTTDQAKDLVGRVRSTTPRIRDAIEKIRRMADTTGKVVTVSGRVLPIDPDPTTGNRRFFGYTGVNHYVQGSCYDLLAEALFAMHHQGLDDALYIAVHDELVVDAAAAAEVEKIMLTPPEAFCEAAGRVPVLRVGRTELGEHWRAK